MERRPWIAMGLVVLNSGVLAVLNLFFLDSLEKKRDCQALFPLLHSGVGSLRLAWIPLLGISLLLLGFAWRRGGKALWPLLLWALALGAAAGFEGGCTLFLLAQSCG